MRKLNYDLLNELMLFGKRILKLLYIFIIAIIAYVALRLLKETSVLNFIWSIIKIIFPFFAGFTLSWILNPLTCKLEEKGLNRTISSTIVFVVFIIFIAVILFMLIPILYNQILDFGDNIPKIFASFNDKLPDIDYNKYFKLFNEQIPSFLISFIKSAISMIGSIGLSLIVTLYFLIDYPKIVKFIKGLVKKNEHICLLVGINREVRKCVNGTLLVATIVFVLDTIFFIIFKLPSPFLFGLICGITDLIPYIGPYIGGVIAVIVGFSESQFIGIATTIIVICVQLLENIILQPIVMSRAIKLHPITIIIALTIFGNLFGVFGMLIATPIVAMLKVVILYFKECAIIKI